MATPLRGPGHAASEWRPECGDLLTLLEFTWFGAQGPPLPVVGAAGEGVATLKPFGTGANDNCSAAVRSSGHESCAGAHSTAQGTAAAEEDPLPAGGQMSPPKGASSSPNTPLSDRLLSHSPATSAASALEQRSPEASSQPLQAAREEPEEATGCSPRSSGSLSVQSIRLCFPPAPMHLVSSGPAPTSSQPAAANTTQPAVARLSDDQWPAAIETTGARAEPARMQYQPGMLTTALQRPPEVAWQLPGKAERQAGGELSPVRCPAAAPQLQQLRPTLQRRPHSLLSMQLKDCSRHSASSQSGLECSGPIAVTPTARDAIAFWSASAGAPAPVLASPGSTSTALPPHCSQSSHHQCLMTAVSAPAPVLAVAADEAEPQGLMGEHPAAAGQRACSLTTMQQAELVQCQQSGAHGGGAESSLGGASVFGSEHRAVRDWLATCSVSGSLDCADSALEEAVEGVLPPVVDPPPCLGGAVHFAAHTVVCVGFSPARRHMSEQKAGARQRAASQLRRAQTCPEPLNQEAATDGLGSWAERIFLHRLGE